MKTAGQDRSSSVPSGFRLERGSQSPRVPSGTGASTCVLGGGGEKSEGAVSFRRARPGGGRRRLAGAREETRSLPPADNSAPHTASTQLAPKDHRRSRHSPSSLKITLVEGGAPFTEMLTWWDPRAHLPWALATRDERRQRDLGMHVILRLVLPFILIIDKSFASRWLGFPLN